MPLMIGLNGSSVDVVLRMVSMILVLWGVGTALGNESGIQGQNNVALLQGNEITTGNIPTFSLQELELEFRYKIFCTLVA